MVYTYKLKTNPKLIKMNSVHTIKTILERTNNQAIKNAILESFSIVNFGNNKRIVRSSQTKRNAVVAKYICKLGYDGYIANAMNKVEGGLFHQELVLCRPYHQLNNDPEVSLSSQAPSAPAKRQRPINISRSPVKNTPLKNDSRFNRFSTPSPTIGGAGPSRNTSTGGTTRKALRF